MDDTLTLAYDEAVVHARDCGHDNKVDLWGCNIATVDDQVQAVQVVRIDFRFHSCWDFQTQDDMVLLSETNARWEIDMDAHVPHNV